MLYMFGIGFVVDEYKKSPKVNIFIDDRLLDSFEVIDGFGTSKIPILPTTHWLPYDEDTYEDDPDEFDTLKHFIASNKVSSILRILYNAHERRKKKYYEHILEQSQHNENYRKLRQNLEVKNWLEFQGANSVIPKKFKIYSIPEEMLIDKKEFIIEVENNDSNYANGFMTKSTTVDLRHMFLLPFTYLKFFRYKKKEFWNAMQKIITKEFEGIGDVCHVDSTFPAYPYPVTTRWNNNVLQSSRVGGSGQLKVKLNRHENLIMFDQNEVNIGRRLYDNDVSTHIKKWLRGKIEEKSSTNEFVYHGLTREHAKLMLEKKPVPAFIFSRLFISLINHGFFDKYIQ